jgi:preprotein translocase subunit SecE
MSVSKTADGSSNLSTRALQKINQYIIMNRLTAYFTESYDELMHRVTWPSLSDLQSSTTIVLVASVVIAFLIWVMDTAALQTLRLVY